MAANDSYGQMVPWGYFELNGNVLVAIHRHPVNIRSACIIIGSGPPSNLIVGIRVCSDGYKVVRLTLVDYCTCRVDITVSGNRVNDHAVGINHTDSQCIPWASFSVMVTHVHNIDVVDAVYACSISVHADFRVVCVTASGINAGTERIRPPNKRLTEIVAGDE